MIKLLEYTLHTLSNFYQQVDIIITFLFRLNIINIEKSVENLISCWGIGKVSEIEICTVQITMTMDHDSIGSLLKNLVPGLACLGGVVPRAQPAHQLRGAAPLAAGHGLGGPHGARVPRGHRRRGLHAPRPRRPRHRALPGQTQQGDCGLRVPGNLI